MKPETYTVFVASNRRGTMRTITVPSYALHLLAALVLVGGITVTAALGSYSRMLWKVANYNALARQQDNLQQQYRQLQSTVTATDQRLSSLQSLATEVAMTYGIVSLRNSPFGPSVSPRSEESFEHSVAQFNFLEKNATAVALSTSGLRLVSVRGLSMVDTAFTPTLWPVIGRITGHFGERLDPFSGEGAFHTGVDISCLYGDSVHAAADGVVVDASERSGYGRAVVVDHGFGVTTLYGHLASFTVPAGTQVKRGDVIGYAGVSGRTTGPHVHYEVRIKDAPVNPMRYLRSTSAAD
jgi:murein DD-endopeptidase MepM/ murein hydrolase activator NlpD